MTAKTSKPAAKKSSPKTAAKSAPVAKRTATGKTLAEAAAKLDFSGLAKEAAAKMAAKPAPTSPAAKTGDLVKRATEVLKRYSGNVEQAMGEAGAQGDAKLAAAIKAIGAPAAKPEAATPAAPSAPAAKPAPAAKSEAPAAKTPAAKPEGEAKREVVPADAKITVLFKENPKRAGTLAARSIGLFKTGMTVGEWRDLCRERDCDPGYLHHSLRRGYIAVK